MSLKLFKWKDLSSSLFSLGLWEYSKKHKTKWQKPLTSHLNFKLFINWIVCLSKRCINFASLSRVFFHTLKIYNKVGKLKRIFDILPREVGKCIKWLPWRNKWVIFQRLTRNSNSSTGDKCKKNNQFCFGILLIGKLLKSLTDAHVYIAS